MTKTEELTTEEKYNQLVGEINRKVNRKVSKIIVQTALKNKMSVIEIEKNHKDYVKKIKRKYLGIAHTLHIMEIHELRKQLSKEGVEVKAKLDFEEYIKEKEEELNAKIKLTTYKKRKREKKLIKQKFFEERVNYKNIAKQMNLDESYVRKIVVELINERDN